MAKTGIKFTERYGVETYQVYKGSTDDLKIPGPDHPLFDKTARTTFDEQIVQEMDLRGGQVMTTAIEVWTDVDTGTLWVVDGRGRTLDLREVNKRRAKAGRELVQALIVPFKGDEKAAIARVRIKNYHRREMTPSGMAIDIVALRKGGHGWSEIADQLHHVTSDPEQWARKLIPLAYCIPEVQQLIDAGKLPRSAAVKFGGSAPEGDKALGKKEQAALLAEIQTKRSTKTEKSKAINLRDRERVQTALGKVDHTHLTNRDALAAHIVSATLAFVAGDTKALKEWPDVAAIVAEAMKPLPKGPKAVKEPKVPKEKKAKGKKTKESAPEASAAN